MSVIQQAYALSQSGDSDWISKALKAFEQAGVARGTAKTMMFPLIYGRSPNFHPTWDTLGVDFATTELSIHHRNSTDWLKVVLQDEGNVTLKQALRPGPKRELPPRYIQSELVRKYGLLTRIQIILDSYEEALKFQEAVQ